MAKKTKHHSKPKPSTKKKNTACSPQIPPASRASPPSPFQVNSTTKPNMDPLQYSQTLLSNKPPRIIFEYDDLPHNTIKARTKPNLTTPRTKPNIPTPDLSHSISDSPSSDSDSDLASTFPFLSLPAELRNKIYTHLVLSPTQPIPLSTTHSSPTYPFSLTLACTQLRHESLHIYYTTNTFSLTLTRHPSTLTPFLTTPLLQSCLHHITTLHLTIHRFGPGSYFATTFHPALSSAILSGSLRRLYVKVRHEHLIGHYGPEWDWELKALNFHSGKSNKSKQEEGFGEGRVAETRKARRAMGLLKGLLRDPDLEDVRLWAYRRREDEVLGWVDDEGDVEDVTALLDRGSVGKSY